MTDILTDIEGIIRDVLDDDEISLSPETTAADVEGWDSLAHVTIIMKVERHFKLRFRVSDVAELSNIGELIALIERGKS
jgi:acyl carrier protein